MIICYKVGKTLKLTIFSSEINIVFVSTFNKFHNYDFIFN